jgi:hypothetical protein
VVDLTLEQAMHIENNNHLSLSMCFTLEKFPRNPPASQYEGSMCLWSALDGGVITAQQAAEIAIRHYSRYIPHYDRWLAHYTNRLAYEYALLEEAGATGLLAKKPKSAAASLPLCNYQVIDGLTIPSRYHKGQMDHYSLAVMTKAEYAAIHTDYKGTRVVGNSHRVRTALIGAVGKRINAYVFLSDSKINEPPADLNSAP